MLGTGFVSAASGGELDAIRSDVRTRSPGSSSTWGDGSPRRDRGRRRNYYGEDNGSDSVFGELFALLLLSGFLKGTEIILSPLRQLCEPASIPEYTFPRFPYDDAEGYMVAGDQYGGTRLSLVDDWRSDPSAGYLDLSPPRPTRRWAGRFRVDYAADFDDIERLGGHLLLSTASGWGLDSQLDFFTERLPAGARDELWLGDCNLVYRLGKSEGCQARVGVGFNWLDDPLDTDFGFNFTYGLDFFPADPWVVSASLDWGTLGHAGLFHFRTTVGAVVHGVEAYTGYEYYDIGTTQENALIAGVRVWF